MTMMFAVFISYLLLVCNPVSSFQPLSQRSSSKFTLVRQKQQSRLNMAFDFPLIPAVLLTTAGVFACKYNNVTLFKYHWFLVSCTLITNFQK